MEYEGFTQTNFTPFKYKIIMERTYTVREFIEHVTESHPKAWGDFIINTSGGCTTIIPYKRGFCYMLAEWESQIDLEISEAFAEDIGRNGMVYNLWV